MNLPERKIEICGSPAKLYARAASLFSDHIEEITGKDRHPLIALSGGSTPRGLYELLASPTYREKIDWQKLYFCFGDERCVPPDAAESNYRMAYDSLLSKVPARGSAIFRFPTELDPAAAAAEYEKTLVAHFGTGWQIDLALMGMGTDGHTASLFPGSPALKKKKQKAAAVYVPQLGTWRLTLTLPVFNSARKVIFLVSGKNKAESVRKVFTASTASIASTASTGARLPAQMIAPGKNTDVLWLLDDNAASLLDEKAIEKFSQNKK